MLSLVSLLQARILASEAEKQELINASEGSAKAVVAAGEARAKSIEIVAKVSSSKSHQIVTHSKMTTEAHDEIFTKPINIYLCPNWCTLIPIYVLGTWSI